MKNQYQNRIQLITQNDLKSDNSYTLVLKRQTMNKASRYRYNTIGELIFWSYANLCMAHAAITSRTEIYSKTHYIIRNHMFTSLKNQTKNIRTIADDEKLKMILPQSCCYCGNSNYLSIDHLLPLSQNGPDTGDNFIWSCRSCNSSKGSKDMMEWFTQKNQFPPLLLLRRYLKLMLEMSIETNKFNSKIENPLQIPYPYNQIPTEFPQPQNLCLWITELTISK